MADRLELNEMIWQIVASIPKGSVATYGLVAKQSGYPNHARFVGRVLKRLPKGSCLPWHRVINSKGELAFPAGSIKYTEQRSRLEDEGVIFDGNHRIALVTYLWQC